MLLQVFSYQMYQRHKKTVRVHTMSSDSFSWNMVRVMGLEPIRLSTHAPQTCLSAYSSTLAFLLSQVLFRRGSPDCFNIISGFLRFVNRFFEIFLDFFKKIFLAPRICRYCVVLLEKIFLKKHKKQRDIIPPLLFCV